MSAWDGLELNIKNNVIFFIQFFLFNFFYSIFFVYFFYLFFLFIFFFYLFFLKRLQYNYREVEKYSFTLELKHEQKSLWKVENLGNPYELNLIYQSPSHILIRKKIKFYFYFFYFFFFLFYFLFLFSCFLIFF
jgi:hypothetical protein